MSCPYVQLFFLSEKYLNARLAIGLHGCTGTVVQAIVQCLLGFKQYFIHN